MFGLAMLHILGRPLLDPMDLKIFNILVIYSFALSSSSRRRSRSMRRCACHAFCSSAASRMCMAFICAAVFITTLLSLIAGGVVFFLLIRLPLGLGLAAIICVVQVSHLWLAMSFVAAIKQYAAVTSAFTLGLSCSVIFGTSAAALGNGPGGMLIGFSIGLAFRSHPQFPYSQDLSRAPDRAARPSRKTTRDTPGIGHLHRRRRLQRPCRMGRQDHRLAIQ